MPLPTECFLQDLSIRITRARPLKSKSMITSGVLTTHKQYEPTKRHWTCRFSRANRGAHQLIIFIKQACSLKWKIASATEAARLIHHYQLRNRSTPKCRIRIRHLLMKKSITITPQFRVMESHLSGNKATMLRYSKSYRTFGTFLEQSETIYKMIRNRSRQVSCELTIRWWLKTITNENF
jgi:hypothetical protein